MVQGAVQDGPQYVILRQGGMSGWPFMWVETGDLYRHMISREEILTTSNSTKQTFITEIPEQSDDAKVRFRLVKNPDVTEGTLRLTLWSKVEGGHYGKCLGYVTAYTSVLLDMAIESF